MSEQPPARPIKALPLRRVVQGLGRVVRIALLVYFGLLLVLSALQSRLLFPGQVSQGNVSTRWIRSYDAEFIELKTESNERVVAFYGPAIPSIDAPRSNSKSDQSNPTVIYFYGNGDCIETSLDTVQMLRKLGLNVLVPDYLGYGLSSGQPSESGCIATAEAVYRYLRDQKPVHPEQIVIMGWSLGGAVAVDLASKFPSAGLAVFSSFTRMRDMVRLAMPIPGLTLLLKHRFDSLQKIAKVQCPILIGHGLNDQMIPPSMSTQLADRATSAVSSFRLRSGHNDFFIADQTKLKKELLHWLTEIDVLKSIADSE